MPAIRMAALGDSFVEGRGDPDLRGPFHGWVPRLAHQLGIPDSGVLRLGAHQATTQDVVDRQLAPALVNKPPLIGVVVGVNDLVSAYDPVRFARNLGTIFDRLGGSDTEVFTATYPDIPHNLPVPARFRELLRGRFEEANGVLRQVCATTGTHVLDIARLPEWSGSALWAEDGLHPNEEGHRRFADSIAELLDRATGLAPTGLAGAAVV